MPKRKPEPHEEMSFEAAMQALEGIVEGLESGDLTLEESLAQFEAGIRLVRVCSQHLDAAEKKVEMLVESEGKMVTKPFALEEEIS